MELPRFGSFVGDYVAKNHLGTNGEHHMILHPRVLL